MTAREIINSIGDSPLYTLHAHTQFCDGRATMEEFVARAALLGFSHYGFTPHSPIPFGSPCNMSRADVPLYLAEVDRLQALYPQVKLYKGMEVDYIDEEWSAANPYFKALGLDYTISSVHFIPNQRGEYYDIDGRPDSFKRKLSENFDGDLRYVVERFFEHSIRMVEIGGFEFIGHFDKIKLNASHCMPDVETKPWYIEGVDALIDSIIASGIAVEINTKSWREFGHLFPAQRHWRRLLQARVPIVVNSDAHYVDRINASRPEVLKSLRYLSQTISQQVT